MDERFKKMEDEFFRLKGQVVAGRITQEQFEAELKKLTIQDSQGRDWQMGAERGKWYLRVGENWVEADPETANLPRAIVNPPPPADLPERGGIPPTLPGRAGKTGATPPPPQGRRCLHWGWAGAILGIALLCVCVLCMALLATPTVTTTPPAVAVKSPTSSQVVSRSFSKDEEFVWSTMGAPSFFSLNMAADDSFDLPLADRYESWHYPQDGVSFTFINGFYVGSDDIGGSLPAGAMLPSVTPAQFKEGMKLQEVASVIGEQPVGTLEIPESVLPGAVFYKFKGVHAGFENGRLVFVETMPYMAAKRSQGPSLDVAPLATIGTTEPKQGVASASSKVTGRVRGLSAPLEMPPISPGKGWKVGWNLFSRGMQAKQATEIGGRSLSISEMEEYLQGAATILREEAKRLRDEARGLEESDPTQKVLNEKAAEEAEKRADAIIKEAIPKFQGAARIERGSDWLNLLLPSWFPGPEPDTKMLRRLMENLLKDKGLRAGEIRESTQNFLKELASDWTKLDKDMRQTAIVEILNAKIRDACKDKPAGDEWNTCFAKTLNTLKQAAAKWAGSEECIKILEQWQKQKGGLELPRASDLLVSLNPPKGQGVAPIAAGAPACPIRGGDLVKFISTPTPTPSPMRSLTPLPKPIPTPTPTPRPTSTPTSILTMNGTFHLKFLPAQFCGPGYDDPIFGTNTEGTVKITVDLKTGAASASLTGGGHRGTYQMGPCAAGAASWTQTSRVDYAGTLNGTIDPATGILTLGSETNLKYGISVSNCKNFGSGPCVPRSGLPDKLPIIFKGSVDKTSGIGKGEVSVRNCITQAHCIGDWSAGP